MSVLDTWMYTGVMLQLRVHRIGFGPALVWLTSMLALERSQIDASYMSLEGL